MPALVVTSGPLTGQRIELTGELIVGRENADLVIDDPEVSRRHASLTPTAAGVQVVDLGSTNGTVVNGARINAPVTLGGGELLQFGETTIEIEADVAVDDGATRLRERPPDPDLTTIRSTPPPDPDLTTTRSTPPPDAAAAPTQAPEETAAYTAPPPEPSPAAADETAATQPRPAEVAPPPPAPSPAPAPAARPERVQAALPDQPFGAFAPPERRGRRGRSVATRLWVPMVLTFVAVGGTATALILYFAGR